MLFIIPHIFRGIEPWIRIWSKSDPQHWYKHRLWKRLCCLLHEFIRQTKNLLIIVCLKYAYLCLNTFLICVCYIYTTLYLTFICVFGGKFSNFSITTKSPSCVSRSPKGFQKWFPKTISEWRKQNLDHQCGRKEYKDLKDLYNTVLHRVY